MWGNNVGYDDQSYDLNASKAGEHYFNFLWDQTPHIYSTARQTIYNGVGTNALTLPAGLSNRCSSLPAAIDAVAASAPAAPATI